MESWGGGIKEWGGECNHVGLISVSCAPHASSPPRPFVLSAPSSWTILPWDFWRTIPSHRWASLSMAPPEGAFFDLSNVVHLQSLFIVFSSKLFYETTLLLVDLFTWSLSFSFTGQTLFWLVDRILSPWSRAWQIKGLPEHLVDARMPPAILLAPLLYRASHLSRPNMAVFLLWQMSQKKKYCKCGKRNRARSVVKY